MKLHKCEDEIDQLLVELGELPLFKREDCSAVEASTAQVSRISAPPKVVFPTYGRTDQSTPDLSDFLMYFECALKATDSIERGWYVYLTANIGGELMSFVARHISETISWNAARAQIEKKFLGAQYRGSQVLELIQMNFKPGETVSQFLHRFNTLYERFLTGASAEEFVFWMLFHKLPENVSGVVDTKLEDHDLTVDQLVKIADKLYAVHRAKPKSSSGSGTGNGSGSGSGSVATNKGAGKTSKWCEYHQSQSHDTANCRLAKGKAPASSDTQKSAEGDSKPAQQHSSSQQVV
ncbi:hypothetical protein LPJ58_002673, partial [Coemansia sp. RSA 1591]